MEVLHNKLDLQEVIALQEKNYLETNF